MPGVAQLSAADFLAACRAYTAGHSRRAAAGSSASAVEREASAESNVLGAHLYSRGWALDDSKVHLNPSLAYLHRSLPVQVWLNADQHREAVDALQEEDWLPDHGDDAATLAATLQAAPARRAGPLPDLSSLSVGNDEAEGALTPKASSSFTKHDGKDGTHPPILATMSQSICYSSTWQVPVFYFSVSRSDGTPLTLEQVVRSSIVQRELDPLLERAGRQDHPPQGHGTDNPPSADLPATFAPISSTEHPITGAPSLYLHPCETASWLETLLTPQVARREAQSALVRSSSTRSSADLSSSPVAGQDDAQAPASEPHAGSPQTADSRERDLCAYFETFVALVASAIEMRL